MEVKKILSLLKERKDELIDGGGVKKFTHLTKEGDKALEIMIDKIKNNINLDMVPEIKTVIYFKNINNIAASVFQRQRIISWVLAEIDTKFIEDQEMNMVDDFLEYISICPMLELNSFEMKSCRVPKFVIKDSDNTDEDIRSYAAFAIAYYEVEKMNKKFKEIRNRFNKGNDKIKALLNEVGTFFNEGEQKYSKEKRESIKSVLQDFIFNKVVFSEKDIASYKLAAFREAKTTLEILAYQKDNQ